PPWSFVTRLPAGQQGAGQLAVTAVASAASALPGGARLGPQGLQRHPPPLALGPQGAPPRGCANTGAPPAACGADTASGRTNRAPPARGPSTPVAPPGVPGAAGATTPGARPVGPSPPGRYSGRPRLGHQGPGPMACPPTGLRPRPTVAQSQARRPAR